MLRNIKGLRILRVLVVIGVILAETIQLNYSAMPSLGTILKQGTMMILVNAMVIASVNLLFCLIFKKWKYTLLITGILFTAWSIANYYVIEFHGSPLFFSEFTNFKTAMTVAGSYHYQISKAVIGLLLIFLVELIAVVILWVSEKESLHKHFNRVIYLILLFSSIGILYLALFSPSAVKPADTMGWTWVSGVEEYGYISCIIEDIQRSQVNFKEPIGGYNSENLDQVVVDDSTANNTYPDIILILNETFCDLSCYTDLDLDVDVFDAFYEIENAVSGYVTAPGIGGGTNDAEFELLTSNSMYLLSRSAPFNYVKLNATGNNFVQNCEKLGYSTLGMHCGIKTNYARNSAYPKLGFDKTLLGEDSFQYYSSYGNREWLDIDNYQDLIDQYSQGRNPAFLYLLTFQNHGGYEQNDSSYDLVHTRRDYGVLTDDIDEFMTSVKMSVDAFIKLTEYYSEVERPVLICMVGDHAPSFIKDLPTTYKYSFEENEIAKRVVPYIIWANYDVTFPENTEFASMVDLVPIMLQAAQMPLTSYYRYILDLHELLPVRMSNGIWMDREGKTGTYGDGSKYDDMLTQYYTMEYNALSGGTEYRRELFEYE